MYACTHFPRFCTADLEHELCMLCAKYCMKQNAARMYFIIAIYVMQKSGSFKLSVHSYDKSSNSNSWVELLFFATSKLSNTVEIPKQHFFFIYKYN